MLPSLAQLSELVDRVIAQVDQVAALPARESPPATGGYVLFAPASDGYRLLPREGTIPESRSTLDVDGARFRVLRHGPSPFPGDRRRCAFLERQEPPQADRTFER